MTSEPLISIITPVYNAERFIEITLQSVVNQSYKNWEHLLVIDNNSKDASDTIIQKFAAQDSRIKLIRSPKAYGAAANRNVALTESQGSYIAFLDADDIWLPQKLEKQLAFMKTKNCQLSYSSYCRISEDGTRVGQKQPVPARLNYDDLLKNNTIACLTAMFEKKNFADIVFQDRGWEDMSFWLQILKRIEFAYGIDEVLAHYRIVTGSRSNNKLFAAKLRWQTYMQVEKLGLIKSTYLFSYYFFTSLGKYIKF